MSEALKNAIKKIALGDTEGICTAQVLAVDKAKNTCDVKVLKNDNEVFDVLLQSIEGEFESPIVAYPVIDSLVTIAFLGKNGDAAIVLKTTEVDEIILGGVTFGGLVKVGELVSKLNELETRFNDFKSKFNAHTHVLTLTSGTGTAAIAANQITSTNLTETEIVDIENEKVKHG